MSQFVASAPSVACRFAPPDTSPRVPRRGGKSVAHIYFFPPPHEAKRRVGEGDRPRDRPKADARINSAVQGQRVGNCSLRRELRHQRVGKFVVAVDVLNVVVVFECVEQLDERFT